MAAHAANGRPREGRERGLAYSLYLPDHEPRAGVVVLHGWGSRRQNHADFALRARGAGLAALVYDARGHGESPGPLGPWAIEDAVAMGDLLRALAPAVAYRGSSMGGFSALHAGALDAEAAAVVAVCPAPAEQLLDGLFSGRLDGVEVDRPALERWLPGAGLEGAVDVLAGRTALLLQHAEADDVVPVAGTRALYERAGEPRALTVVSGGDHRSAQHDPGLQDESVAWVLEAAGRRASRA